MKKRNIITLTAALAVLTFTSCVPDIDLAGNAWTNTGYYYEDGERVTTELTLVCTSTNSGTLFISERYSGDPMGSCFAMPFTYTWNDNQGTATATLEFPEDWKSGKASPKGTYTFSISMYYTKTEGLVISSSDIEQMLEIPCTSLGMVKKEHAKPTNMTGTRWVMEFDDTIDIPEGGTETTHYHYELHFISAATATLALTSEDWNERWSINYTYADGVGRTSINFDGENVNGGFYMPNENTMLFSDGMNGLYFVKQ